MLGTIRSLLRTGNAARPALLIAGALALGACDDDDDPIDPGPATEWAAELSGEGEFEDVTGAAVVLARSSTLTAEIEVEGAADGDVFSWAIHEGTCADPGDRIGDADAYPELEADGNGAAAAEADDDVTLTEGEAYLILVTAESGDDTVTVACSALTEVDD